MLAPSIIFFPSPVSEYLADFNDLFMALDLLWSQLLGEHIISLATPNILNTPFIGFCTMKLPYKGKLSNSVCMAHLFKLSKTTSESAILTWDIYSTSAPQIFVVVVSLTSTIATRPTGPTFYVSPPSLIMTSTCIFVGNIFFKDAGTAVTLGNTKNNYWKCEGFMAVNKSWYTQGPKAGLWQRELIS